MYNQQIKEENEQIQPMDIHSPIEGVLISEAVVKTAPLLEIQIMEGKESMIGKQLKINAQGLIGSQRKKKDGCTIIGSQDQNFQTGEFYNDFVINNEILEKTEGDQSNNAANGGIGKRHMVIKYNEDDKKYYLRDLGDGSGTFIRVDN